MLRKSYTAGSCGEQRNNGIFKRIESERYLSPYQVVIESIESSNLKSYILPIKSFVLLYISSPECAKKYWYLYGRDSKGEIIHTYIEPIDVLQEVKNFLKNKCPFTITPEKKKTLFSILCRSLGYPNPTPITGIVKLKDREGFVTYNCQGIIQIWGYEPENITFKLAKTINYPRSTVIFNLVQLDGSTLAACDNHGSIYIWNIETGKVIKESLFKQEKYSIRTMLLWGTNIILFAAGTKLYLGNIQNGLYKKIVETPSVTRILIRIDPKFFAAAGGDNNIYIWRLFAEEGRQVCKLVLTLSGGELIQDMLKISNTIVSGDKEGTVRIWNLSNLQNPSQKTIKAHAGRVSGIVNINDNYFITFGVDSVINLFSMKGELLGREEMSYTIYGMTYFPKHNKLICFDATGILQIDKLRLPAPAASLAEQGIFFQPEPACNSKSEGDIYEPPKPSNV